MTICRQKTVPGVLRLLRIVVNSPGCAIQNNNTNTYNNTQSKYRIYILVTLSSIQGFSASGCISCIVCDTSSPIVLRTCSKYCIVVGQLHRLYRPHKDCHLYTESLHLSVWNLKAPFVIHFNVFSNRYQMLKIKLISLTNLSTVTLWVQFDIAGDSRDLSTLDLYLKGNVAPSRDEEFL